MASRWVGGQDAGLRSDRARIPRTRAVPSGVATRDDVEIPAAVQSRIVAGQLSSVYVVPQPDGPQEAGIPQLGYGGGRDRVMNDDAEVMCARPDV